MADNESLVFIIISGGVVGGIVGVLTWVSLGFCLINTILIIIIAGIGGMIAGHYSKSSVYGPVLGGCAVFIGGTISGIIYIYTIVIPQSKDAWFPPEPAALIFSTAISAVFAGGIYLIIGYVARSHYLSKGTKGSKKGEG
jgi:hypothetical protein